MARQKKLLIITKRLVILATLSLVVAAILFAVTIFIGLPLYMSWFAFECGIMGGFVSIQQRLKRIGDEELTLLSESWATILLIPVYGGVFSLVLFVLFLSGLLKGHLFPEFWVPDFGVPPTIDNIKEFLTKSYPASAADFAKFAFWSFVAGFSERFVPQVIKQVTSTNKEVPESSNLNSSPNQN